MGTILAITGLDGARRTGQGVRNLLPVDGLHTASPPRLGGTVAPGDAVEPVRVRVLGSLQLGDDDAAQPRSARLRKLLAVLLVYRGTAVSADRLAQAVWGGCQPADPSAALQSLVWRLRQALHATGCEGAVRLLTRPPGYLLEVEGEQVDGVRFERQVRAAAAESPERAVGLLEDALSLWRGPAYAEFADDDIVRVEATRLEELQLTARLDWVDGLLALDRPGETLARLTVTVEADPLRERPRAQLMRALHRLGRTAEALQVYREYRNLLTAELGLDPSPSLRNLQAAILQQRREPDRAPPATGHPSLPSRPPGNLRLELSDLLGRDDEVAAAQATLERFRVVTLSGVGGVGKTRLALRVAADSRPRYRDGAWLCELAGVADPSAVPDLVATTLGVQQRLNHTVTDRLVEYLRARSMLLLLDNCEHVLGAVTDLVDTLVRDCPDLTVLATSREPLGIDGERVLPVQPLPVPPAAMPGGAPAAAAVPSVALFSQRATAAAPAFVLTDDNIAAVTEICRRLDGLPLALELAATRVRSLSPAEIADRLERRLSFLRSGRRIRQERHRTLASAVDWSYRLLTPGEQAVFDRCSMFMGSFTLAAAVAVVGESEPAVVDDVSGWWTSRCWSPIPTTPPCDSPCWRPCARTGGNGLPNETKPSKPAPPTPPITSSSPKLPMRGCGARRRARGRRRSPPRSTTCAAPTNGRWSTGRLWQCGCRPRCSCTANPAPHLKSLLGRREPLPPHPSTRYCPSCSRPRPAPASAATSHKRPRTLNTHSVRLPRAAPPAATPSSHLLTSPCSKAD